MKSWFSRKMSASPFRSSNAKPRGAVLMVTVFMFLAFTILALSMIFLSQVYLRLGGFRKNSVLLDYSAENGIKGGFRHLIENMTAAPVPIVITEEEFGRLRTSAQLSQPDIIEAALGIQLPVEVQEENGLMAWQSQTGCELERLIETEDYCLAGFRISIDSEGRLKNFRPLRTASLEIRADVLAGHVPLPFISFLIDKKLDSGEKASFTADNNITLLQPPGLLPPTRVDFSEGNLIPQDAAPLLEKALQTKIFYPQDLSPAKLRPVLGLEASTDPVPPGVYLIRNDLGLGGLYVEGDVLEMVTAVEDDFQVITFRLEAGTWTIRYSPAKSRTQFSGPQDVESFDLVPIGIIMVSGKIASLGGGIVSTDGSAVLVKDREVESILNGVRLTLVASDKITISSHLIQQRMTWQEGIPYVKDNSAQLIICSTGQDFAQAQPREGGILIGADAPAEIKIQASLAAQGAGFEIQGTDKIVELQGGLQAADYISGGNELKFTPLPPQANARNLDLNAPQTTQPILCLGLIKTLEWKEL
jgi:hypothetical protein